jgi:murein DD-endopeptidase MepM/ murein hydrolase activator NlpD
MLMGFDPVHAPALGHRRLVTSRVQSILADRTSAIRFRHAAAFVIVALGVLSVAAGPGETDISPQTTPDLDPGPTRERLDHPLPGGRLTWGWGPGRDPFNGSEVHHRGIDLAAPPGTAILAPAEATVRVATELWPPSPGSGMVLILDHHGGLSTFFAHLQEIGVSPGDVVKRGEIVARVGSSGRSTGPHLHFEVWQTDEPVNPLDHLAPLQ